MGVEGAARWFSIDWVVSRELSYKVSQANVFLVDSWCLGVHGDLFTIPTIRRTYSHPSAPGFKRYRLRTTERTKSTPRTVVTVEAHAERLLQCRRVCPALNEVGVEAITSRVPICEHELVHIGHLTGIK